MAISQSRRTSLALLTLVAFTGSAMLAQNTVHDSLTVEETVRVAIANSPALQQAAATVQASSARVEQTKTVDLPAVAFEGSYVRIGPVPQLSFPGLGVFKLYPENNYDAHVDVHQKVYDFGQSSASVDVSRSRVESAQISGDLIRYGLAYQTIQVFYSILYLEQGIQVEDQEINTLRQHLEVTKKRTESGTGTDFEVLTTQVRVAAAENQRVDLENMLEKQRITLRRMLGVPESTPVNLRGRFEVEPVNLNTDSLVALAMQQRPEYRAAQSEVQTATLQFRLAQVSDLPTLNVNAAYGVKNGYIPNLDILHGNWVAGVELQVPLYEGNRTQYKEEEAQATLGGSQAHVTDVERQITSDVRQAVSDVRTAMGKLATSLLQVQQATDALSIAQKRYDAGTVNNLDVLDAETSLSQAHLLRLRAQYEYVSSRYALERSVGSPIWK